MFFQMMMKSIRRRKRELRYVSAVTFIAVLFLTSVSVFQNTMDQYVTVTNYENYGEWILSSVEDPGSREVTFRDLEHPYFSKTGICRTGPGILDADGEDSNLSIGTLDEALMDIGEIFPCTKAVCRKKTVRSPWIFPPLPHWDTAMKWGRR